MIQIGFTVDEVCEALSRMIPKREFYDTLELPTGWTLKDEKDLRTYISETIEPMRLTH